MFLDKKKNGVAIAFTVFYLVMLIVDLDFLEFPIMQNWRYAINSLLIYLLPMLVPVTVFVYLLKGRMLNRWLLPVEFGLLLVLNIFTWINSLPMYLQLMEQRWPTLLCTCLILMTLAALFVGSLMAGRTRHLLRWSALVMAILQASVWILEFVYYGGFADLKVQLSHMTLASTLAWIRLAAQVLFYIGIFLCVTGKKNTHSEQQVTAPTL